MRVELIGHLKAEAGREYIEVSIEHEEERLLDVLKRLPERIRRHIIETDTGRLVPGLLILVNGTEIKPSRITDAMVREDDVITLIPAIHGGRT